MAVDANAKQRNFKQLKTASGKCRTNMVTWSLLPFSVNVVLNLSTNSDVTTANKLTPKEYVNPRLLRIGRLIANQLSE